MSEIIKPTVIIGRNAIALVRHGIEGVPDGRGFIPPTGGEDDRVLVLVGPVELVKEGRGAVIHTRGEAFAVASALEAVARVLPIE